MINLIVGENSTGKTLYLKSLAKSNKGLTNLERLDMYINVPYNKSRLKSLRALDICDVDESNPYILSLAEPDRPLTTKFIELVTLMCKEGDILMLDEPDKGLLWYEDYHFISFLLSVSGSFKDIYIVTHDDEMMVLSVMNKANFMTVKKDKGTVISYNITKEQANELIDKV